MPSRKISFKTPPEDTLPASLEEAINSRKVAVALSGGGIRSASTCSGGLRHLLRNGFTVKALSSVSGGGYLGSAFSIFRWSRQHYKPSPKGGPRWKQAPAAHAMGNEPDDGKFFRRFRNRVGYLVNWSEQAYDTVSLFDDTRAKISDVLSYVPALSWCFKGPTGNKGNNILSRGFNTSPRTPNSWEGVLGGVADLLFAVITVCFAVFMSGSYVILPGILLAPSFDYVLGNDIRTYLHTENSTGLFLAGMSNASLAAHNTFLGLNDGSLLSNYTAMLMTRLETTTGTIGYAALAVTILAFLFLVFGNGNDLTMKKRNPRIDVVPVDPQRSEISSIRCTIHDVSEAVRSRVARTGLIAILGMNPKFRNLNGAHKDATVDEDQPCTVTFTYEVPDDACADVKDLLQNHDQLPCEGRTLTLMAPPSPNNRRKRRVCNLLAFLGWCIVWSLASIEVYIANLKAKSGDGVPFVSTVSVVLILAGVIIRHFAAHVGKIFQSFTVLSIVQSIYSRFALLYIMRGEIVGGYNGCTLKFICYSDEVWRYLTMYCCFCLALRPLIESISRRVLSEYYAKRLSWAFYLDSQISMDQLGYAQYEDDPQRNVPTYVATTTVNDWLSYAANQLPWDVFTISPDGFRRIDGNDWIPETDRLRRNNGEEFETYHRFPDQFQGNPGIFRKIWYFLVGDEKVEVREAMGASASAVSNSMGAYNEATAKSRGVVSFLGLGLGKWFSTGTAPERLNSPKKFVGVLALYWLFTATVAGVMYSTTPTEPNEGSHIVLAYAVYALGHLLFVVIFNDGLRVEMSRFIPYFAWLSNIMNFDYLVMEWPAALYLSDGGHAENLGLLPLLHRREKRIFSIDGSADPEETCEALILAADLARERWGFHFYAIGDDSKLIDFETGLKTILVNNPCRREFTFIVKYDDTRIGVVTYIKPRKQGRAGVQKPSEEVPEVASNSIYGGVSCYSEASYPEDEGVFSAHEAIADSNTWNSYKDERMHGMCCDGCQGPCGQKLSCCLGTFPHHTTANQFFTPTLFDGYHMEGRLGMVEGLHRAEHINAGRLISSLNAVGGV